MIPSTPCSTDSSFEVLHTAYVVKMFRQVQVVERNWNFQLILWRPSVDHPVKEYVITVIVWGMASATFDDLLSGSDDTLYEQMSHVLIRYK